MTSQEYQTYKAIFHICPRCSQQWHHIDLFNCSSHEVVNNEGANVNLHNLCTVCIYQLLIQNDQVKILLE